MTFKELDTHANNMAWNDPAGEGVNYFIAHAADNGTTDSERFDSLRIMLSFPNEYRAPVVVAWFASRGITA